MSSESHKVALVGWVLRCCSWHLASDMRHKQPISINLINCKFHLKLESPNRPVAAAPAHVCLCHAQTHSLLFYASINFNILENWLSDGQAQHLRIECDCCVVIDGDVRAFMEDKTTSHAPLSMLHSFHIQQNCKCRVIKIKKHKNETNIKCLFDAEWVLFVSNVW